MNITFNRLTVSNFKSHSALRIEFGDITNIFGTNGAGKSSIGEAISWVLYGTDPLGTKLDPTPLTGLTGTVQAELLLTVDDKQLLLAREIASGKNKFYVNEVPEKATKYSELVEALFDKDLFLSLFTPGFFFTQHWEKQRSQLLSYVAEPTNKEVLAQLSTVAQERLGEALLKKSLDDLDKMHRDNKNKTDKELQRLDGMWQMANDRNLNALNQVNPLPDMTFEQLKEERDRLVAQIGEHDIHVHAQQQYDRERNRLESDVRIKEAAATSAKNEYVRKKEEQVTVMCRTCGQDLSDELQAQAHAKHDSELQQKLDSARALLADYKTAQAALEAHRTMPRPVVPDLSELNQQLQTVNDAGRVLKAIEDTKKELDDVSAKRKETAKSNTASDSMIDWIKAFRAKRAEITANKVADLFTTLSIRLFNETRDGDQKPTFEIEMNGVPYSKLSTAEKIKAGLELNEVLSIQSGVVAPVFVDNAESILRFRKPVGQLIVARVQDSELRITVENLETEGVAVNE